MIENIGKVLGGEVHMPTYSDGEFGTLNGHSSFSKVYTDYAYQVLTQHSGRHAIYRGADLTPFSAPGMIMPDYTDNSSGYWWLGTQYENNNEAWSFIPNGSLYPSYSISWVMGVVVAIR